LGLVSIEDWGEEKFTADEVDKMHKWEKNWLIERSVPK